MPDEDISSEDETSESYSLSGPTCTRNCRSECRQEIRRVNDLVLGLKENVKDIQELLKALVAEISPLRGSVASISNLYSYNNCSPSLSID